MWHEPVLRKWLASRLKAKLGRLRDRHHIEIDDACVLLMVPDPFGVLEPDECSITLSDRQLSSTFTRVAVVRNPCLRASDVQVLKLRRDDARLSALKNVIVMSTHSSCTRSAASDLSGGDYDGDTAMCLFDEQIIPPRTVARVAFPVESQLVCVERKMDQFDTSGDAVEALCQVIAQFQPMGAVGVLCTRWQVRMWSIQSFVCVF